MELIDNWGGKERASQPGSKEPVSRQPDWTNVRAALESIEPRIINVHCYEDVGHPWVQVVFEAVIRPDVALSVGDVLAGVPGTKAVYLNSLRPRAVYFLLEPAFSPAPDLPASRYGSPLSEIRASWRPSARDTGSRLRPGQRGRR